MSVISQTILAAGGYISRSLSMMAGTVIRWLSATSDTAALGGVVKAGDAWSQASLSTAGANLAVAGGIGRRFCTAVSNTLGAVTITINCNEATYTFLSGAQFNLGSDNSAEELNVTADNLAAAINGHLACSLLMTATVVGATSPIVYLQPKEGCWELYIATSASARISVTQGEDGIVVLKVNGASSKPIIGWKTAAGSGYSGLGPPNSSWPDEVALFANGVQVVEITSGQFIFTANPIIGASGALYWSNRATLWSPVDGDILVRNQAATQGSGYIKANGMKFDNGVANHAILQGAGTPEGAVTAPPGSLFLRTDGGAGTSLYVKETGTGNTGWVGK
jgi:hypothetical protein